MLDRYWVFPRKSGMFYFQDKITGKQQSARTQDRVVAERLLAAKNQAVEQPMLNRSMAKTYLAAKSPELMERTWADVVARYAQGGSQESMDRKARAFRSQPFARLLKVKLMDTEADHLFAVLEHKKAGNAAHHYMRRIHNYALQLGWLLSPVMADAAWPPIRKKHYEANPSRVRESGEWICCGVDAGATGFFDFGLGVNTVRHFTGNLLSRLGNVGSALSQILPVLLHFVNDFLVVRYISWIGHD